MFRITEDPSSGNLMQYLVKNYKNNPIVSVDMDKVGVMAAYCDPLCLYVVHCIILIVSTYYILCISWIMKRLVQEKFVEKMKVHVLSLATFSENYSIYEIMWKNKVDQERSQMKI